MILETPRLIIRALTEDDVAGLASIQADPEVMRFFASGVRSREQTAEDVARCQAIQAEHGFSLWAAIDRAEGHLIGRCGLLPQTLRGAVEVEVAYLIARSHWGRGLATEAARAIRDHAWSDLGLRRLVSIIHRDNWASRRVADKLGMHPERVLQFMDHRCWLYATEPEPGSVALTRVAP